MTQPRKAPVTINACITILTTLHESMKEIRQARRDREGSDVKLSRIYREAVEQYVNAKPQQQLLKEFAGDETTPKTRAAADRLAARV